MNVTLERRAKEYVFLSEFSLTNIKNENCFVADRQTSIFVGRIWWNNFIQLFQTVRCEMLKSKQKTKRNTKEILSFQRRNHFERTR